MTSLAVSGFGKLPTYGDFIRHNADGSAVRGLDEWLQRGLYFLQSRRGPGFDAAYDAAPALGFSFRSGRGRLPLVGVLRLSRDQAGRKFPFVIAREADEVPDGDEAPLPAGYERFYEASADLVGEVTAGRVGYRDVPARLQALDALGATSAAGYGHYLRRTSFGALGASLWPHFDDSRKYLLFKNLLDVVLPYRNGGAPVLAAGLRFPLGAKEALYGATFWMDVCRRLLRANPGDASYFWTMRSAPHASGDPAAAQLLLFFQPPPHRAFGELLSIAEARSDTVVDLQAVGREQAVAAALAIPPQYGVLLEDETLTLEDFLARL